MRLGGSGNEARRRSGNKARRTSMSTQIEL